MCRTFVKFLFIDFLFRLVLLFSHSPTADVDPRLGGETENEMAPIQARCCKCYNSLTPNSLKAGVITNHFTHSLCSVDQSISSVSSFVGFSVPHF